MWTRHSSQIVKIVYLDSREALLQNPREMIRGRMFREMIWVSAQKSELQAKSRSYRPKVRVTAGSRVRTEFSSTENLPKAFLNPPKTIVLLAPILAHDAKGVKSAHAVQIQHLATYSLMCSRIAGDQSDRAAQHIGTGNVQSPIA